MLIYLFFGMVHTILRLWQEYKADSKNTMHVLLYSTACFVPGTRHQHLSLLLEVKITATATTTTRQRQEQYHYPVFNLLSSLFVEKTLY